MYIVFFEWRWFVKIVNGNVLFYNQNQPWFTKKRRRNGFDYNLKKRYSTNVIIVKKLMENLPCVHSFKR